MNTPLSLADITALGVLGDIFRFDVFVTDPTKADVSLDIVTGDREVAVSVLRKELTERDLYVVEVRLGTIQRIEASYVKDYSGNMHFKEDSLNYVEGYLVRCLKNPAVDTCETPF
jgi:hypothetical protein